ncbi:MAG: hypothetical protein WA156_01230 [Methylocystis silviterrae]
MKILSFRRVGATCAIAGAVVTGVFNGMHPELADPSGIVQNAAGSSKWIAVHWGLIIGMVQMQIGFSVFAQTLRHPTEGRETGEWGLLGIYMLMVGLALWICVFTAEVGLKPLADTARVDQFRQGGALALSNFVDATATAATIVYWLGAALLGVASLRSTRYPRWMGVTGSAVGAFMILGVGIPKAFLGASAWTERVAFPALAILFLIWTVILGTLLWRDSDMHAAPQRNM